MNLSKQAINRIIYTILALGASLRVLVYLQNRSLFIDEASLSSQLVAGSFREMFGNFVHQYAPPLFNVLVKSATEIFGATEYALRLLPLLAGLISIWLFYRLCQYFLAQKHLIFPLLLFCFSMYLVRYSTEVKQYTTDIAVTLGLLLFCLRKPEGDWVNTQFITWSVLGIISVWLSMPAVFVLFGIGMYYGIHFLKTKNQSSFLGWCFVIISWLISFGIYFFGIIQNDIGHEGLENYHSPFFFPLVPDSVAELKRGAELILGFYRTAIGSTVIAILWGLITTLIGFYQLFKQRKLLGWLFLLPILACILASGLKYYSLIPRLTLFLIPLLVLMIGIGTQRLFQASPKYLSWVYLGCLLIIVANQKSYPYFFKKYQIEEIKPVLEHLAKHVEANDWVYVHYQAENAYRFYTQEYKHAESYQFNTTIGKWDDTFPDAVSHSSASRVWLVFSHLKKEEVDNVLSAFVEQLDHEKRLEAKGAFTYPLLIQKLSD